MNTKSLLTAKLDQPMVMNQQLRQAISLLQYTTLDLKQLVQQYIETNPLIEVIDSDTTEALDEYEYEAGTYPAKYSSKFKRSDLNEDDINTLDNYSPPKNLRDHLLEQVLLCKFTVAEQIIAEALIDAIDENGYLTISLTDLQLALKSQLNVSIESIVTILTSIQSLDPIGIGARTVQECLLLQLKAKQTNSEAWHAAYHLISEHFEALSANHAKRIQSALKISPAVYTKSIALIRTLDPKPGLAYGGHVNIPIEPELFVKKIKNQWRVFLNQSILTNIKVNAQYQGIIKQYKNHDSYEALNRELQEAQWLLKGLQRRNETLLNVATHIVELQKDFLEYGPQFMKPMNIIDVSQTLNLHESTVSRVTTGKYIATQRGMFELKYFFPSYVLTESGTTCSATRVKDMIKDIISQESTDHQYSDGEITSLLKKQGINIARRTVAKYREALKILPSYQRL